MSNINKGINRQLKRMDAQKNILMDLIRPMPNDLYRQQINQHTWSIAQIANHLYLSERLSLTYLRKKLSYPDTLLPYNPKSWWSLFIVNFTLWSPLKVKAPKPINMREGQEVLSPDQLNEKWIQLRSEFTTFILENQKQYASHLVFNHPFGGRMTMHQMLIFFNHHIAHHIRQIRHVMRKANWM